MTTIARKSSELLRAARTSEVTLTLLPVGLVLAFGIGWLFVRPDFFFQDDMQMQYLPASREIAHALWAGELPILSKLCWYGGALAGEYQHGIFSLSTLILTCVVWKLGLTLPYTAAALVMSHLSILAAGAFRLARSRGLCVQEATLVAVIASLNGWIIGWGAAWYPGLTSFAWIPWAWWALERALSKPSAAVILLAGFFLYLILAAGWPIAVLVAGVLSVCLVVRAALAARNPIAVWPACAAWMMALGLAAPALLMVVEYGAVTQRVAHQGLVFTRNWLFPLEGLGGMILPAFHTWWRAYDGAWSLRASIELAGGLLPLCATAYAVGVRGARSLWSFDALIALLALSFAALPCIAPLQVSFRWLPMLHLAFALAGASCLHTSKAAEGVAHVHLRLALIAAGSVLFTLLLSTGADADPTTNTVQLGKWTVALALVWAACERYLPRLLAGWGPVAFCLASLAAAYALLHPVPEPPQWKLDESMRQAGPLEPQRRYLSLFDFGDMVKIVNANGREHREGGAAKLRPGYSGMYADLQFLNGYSAMTPMGPAAILDFNVHAEVNRWRSVEILRSETGEGGLLDLMAVDGLVLATALEREVPGLRQVGWRQVATIEDGLVLHRERGPSARVRSLSRLEGLADQTQLVARLRRRDLAPAPLVEVSGRLGLETFAHAALGEVEEQRLHSRVQIAVPPGPQQALIMFARPWLPGWRATLNGRRLKVFAVNELMPAVRVPAGERGELVLEYRPIALRRGAWSMAITLVLVAAWWLWERRRARPRSTA
jgi:hypothetical protein